MTSPLRVLAMSFGASAVGATCRGPCHGILFPAVAFGVIESVARADLMESKATPGLQDFADGAMAGFISCAIRATFKEREKLILGAIGPL